MEKYKVLIYLLEPFTRCVRAKFSGINKQRLEETRKFIKIKKKGLKTFVFL